VQTNQHVRSAVDGNECKRKPHNPRSSRRDVAAGWLASAVAALQTTYCQWTIHATSVFVLLGRRRRGPRRDLVPIACSLARRIPKSPAAAAAAVPSEPNASREMRAVATPAYAMNNSRLLSFVAPTQTAADLDDSVQGNLGRACRRSSGASPGGSGPQQTATSKKKALLYVNDLAVYSTRSLSSCAEGNLGRACRRSSGASPGGSCSQQTATSKKKTLFLTTWQFTTVPRYRALSCNSGPYPTEPVLSRL
jgi:hypothetical protein